MWPDDPLEVYVSAGEYALVETMRQEVATVADEWAVDDVDGLVLLVDELVTNGLDHGGTTVKVECRRAPDGAVEVEVTDRGPGQPRTGTPALDSTHGRGLLLVDHLAIRWGVRPNPVGKTVWAEYAPQAA